MAKANRIMLTNFFTNFSILHTLLMLFKLCNADRLVTCKHGREYAVDRYALELVPDLPAFESTFVALAKQNLSDPEPLEWVEFWLHNHPSIARRLEPARRTVRSG